MDYTEKRIKEWKQYMDKIIIQKIGKEKIIKYNKKRWREYLKKHEYKISPEQEYYNKVEKWKQ